jgi:hypothetical protein
MLASRIRPSSLTDVHVFTTKGVVTLAGQVESVEVKERAEEGQDSWTDKPPASVRQSTLGSTANGTSE